MDFRLSWDDWMGWVPTFANWMIWWVSINRWSVRRNDCEMTAKWKAGQWLTEWTERAERAERAEWTDNEPMSDEDDQTRLPGAAKNSLILFLFASLPVCTLLPKDATLEHSILFRKKISLLVFFLLADKPQGLAWLAGRTCWVPKKDWHFLISFGSLSSVSNGRLEQTTNLDKSEVLCAILPVHSDWLHSFGSSKIQVAFSSALSVQLVGSVSFGTKKKSPGL